MSISTRQIFKLVRKSKWFKQIKANLNYRKVKGYANTEEIATWLAAQLMTAELNSQVNTEDLAQMRSFCAAYDATQEIIPCYWLTEALALALTLTNLPDHWIEVKPFVSRGIILTPKLIKSPDNQWLEWFYFDYLYPKEQRCPIEIETFKIHRQPSEIPKLTWATILSDGTAYSSTIDLEQKSQDFSRHENIVIDDFVASENKNIDSRIEAQFTKALENLCFQILLYMMSLPSTSSNPKASYRKAPRGRLPKTHPREPKWIGKEYQLKKQTIRKSESYIHHLPRVHHRRGHWRHQPYGSRSNPQVKVIWIEPTAVVSC